MQARSRLEPLSALTTAGADREEARREPGMAAVALSAIVPLFRDRSDALEVYAAYKGALESLGRPYELIYVLSWQSERALADLKALKQGGEDALVLVVGQQVDEAEALLSGFERARGEVVLTLPADLQVEPADIPKVVEELERCEVAGGRRPPTSPTP
jgi:dolichol-phosphate mannosyltransferase